MVKQAASDELFTALRKVLKGESYLSSLITKDTVEFLLRNGKSISEERRITKRQSKVRLAISSDYRLA